MSLLFLSRILCAFTLHCLLSVQPSNGSLATARTVFFLFAVGSLGGQTWVDSASLLSVDSWVTSYLLFDRQCCVESSLEPYCFRAWESVSSHANDGWKDENQWGIFVWCDSVLQPGVTALCASPPFRTYGKSVSPQTKCFSELWLFLNVIMRNDIST